MFDYDDGIWIWKDGLVVRDVMILVLVCVFFEVNLLKYFVFFLWLYLLK